MFLLIKPKIHIFYSQLIYENENTAISISGCVFPLGGDLLLLCYLYILQNILAVFIFFKS
jgi:hypothetical protein